ncbi:MAG TPA: hypothetical protein VFY73_23045 [Ideonella sp.]|uniref:hypothetical protein n=1 Tax=Ideonella sp. TaxID=1929293 RepID=UPI002E35833A|nr:hypothetical protein [Ideonella sp.]HEX5686898.1 hypothetical protein [Ideonella sp.]
MHKHTIRTTLLTALLSGGLIAAGHAQTSDNDMPSRLLPSHAKAWMLRHAAQQKAARALKSQTAGVDTTAPVLTRFESAASVDVTRAMSSISVAVRAADDMSGVRTGWAYASGPSGQLVNVSFFDNLPAKKLSGRMASNEVSPFLEPGTYTFEAAFVGDVAGNYSSLDQASLAALGKATFVVKNTAGFDRTAPALLSGRVSTPHVSLSAKQPGTDLSAYIGLTMEAADTGNSALSGVRNAYVTYCLLDQSNCFNLASDNTGLPRRAGPVTLRLGGQVDPAWAAGEYHLTWVVTVDYAENNQQLYGTDFGGPTDFNAYFPSTTITITP